MRTLDNVMRLRRALALGCLLATASSCSGNRAVQPSAEPGGELVLVTHVAGDFEIARYRFADSTIVNISNSPGLDYVPTWTPDGDGIVFYSDRGGNWDVYVMNADGTGARNLTNHPGRDMFASAGRRGLIAFVSDRDGDRDVYVMGADGSNVRALTTNDWTDEGPAWSPDGGRIAYASSSNPEGPDIHVLDLDTGDDRVLVERAGVDGSPSWSPDGGRIAFYGAHGDSISIFVVAADGTGLRRLPNGVADERHPRWSPDGQWLVITGATGDNTNPNTDIWVMRPDGTDRRRLTHETTRQEYAAWRPTERVNR